MDILGLIVVVIFALLLLAALIGPRLESRREAEES
jgi:hypothetical protein